IDNIKVTVGKAPAGIVTQLTSVEATEGDGVSFSIKANGDEPLFYKWFKGDTEIAGAEGPVLELSDVSEEDAGSYSVVVSNSAGSATSNPARLAVLLKPGSFLVFTEDFNSLELGPNVDEGVANEAAWTDTPPTGWTVDDSGVPGVDDPATDGVTEWAGWSFANAEWWITAAGDQNRSKFTKATGNAAV
ncbi:MAG: hypothetical protein GY911_14965, partial [Actinomycetales bacterium]|nr:hypothetical protein [Actinomycetales bacterium]